MTSEFTEAEAEIGLNKLALKLGAPVAALPLPEGILPGCWTKLWALSLTLIGMR